MFGDRQTDVHPETEPVICCRPPVPVFIEVLDLLTASGQNPHATPYTVIKKIWEACHPESFAFASKHWESKPQPYSQHNARELAEPVSYTHLTLPTKRIV